ncbi:major facilitator superfamily transporter [Crepidotus variabilis]|uniref:Major facilitator superfamily transporter n=1 Tax=Crepidotus variabilis TaxID=179855 RepID=A0A9P6EP77_9AGAR|nr:major facilitator superfamily transporter [Crepidotus variabilis]
MDSPPQCSTPTHDHERCDEETPLLKKSWRRERTPLPKLQIGIVLFMQVCEPICSMSIYPYINELVGSLDIIGGDETKVGYYAGLIESLFFATEALTVFQWSRTSDRVGRKPVLLMGLFGTMISILLFGLSRTFWTLVLSRCLCGLLNGNIGVMKSAMGELTDSTNRADAFAMMPVVWSFGATIGPLVGGSLAKPSGRLPGFDGQFWEDYPYFLPCIATAGSVLLTIFITLFYFQETTTAWRRPSRKRSESCDTLVNEASTEEAAGLSALLTKPIIIPIANYVSLAFLNISMNALLPLFMYMPIELGGLGLSPQTIGYVIGGYGAGTGLYQFFFFSALVRRFGTRRMFVMCVSTFIPAFLIFPFISLFAKTWGLGFPVWIGLSSVLLLMFMMDTAYGCIFMSITESAPNRQSLGAVNGLAQTTVSIARSIGPALASSLFSLSVQRSWAGGYGVYFVLAVFSVGALVLANQLPYEVVEKCEDY